MLDHPALLPHGRSMPVRYTAEGADVSPPLEWADTPSGTQSYVLIVDDPDAPDPRAPRQTWVHWIRYMHKLYALDMVLPELGQPTKAQLLDAMHGHVLAESRLVGTYQARV